MQHGIFGRLMGIVRAIQRPLTTSKNVDLTTDMPPPPDGLKRWIALNLIDRRFVEGGPWTEVNCILKLERLLERGILRT